MKTKQTNKKRNKKLANNGHCWARQKPGTGHGTTSKSLIG